MRIIEEGVNKSFTRGYFTREGFLEYFSSYYPIEDVEHTADIIRQAMKKMPKTKEYLTLVRNITNLNSNIRERLYGVCFSEYYDDDHSWSEYADRKRGFVVEYTLYKNKYTETERSLITSILPVLYASKNPVSLIDIMKIAYTLKKYGEIEEDEAVIENLFIHLLTKKECWMNQSEWRMWNLKERCTIQKQQFDFASKIILGENISSDNEEKLKIVANNLNIQLVKQGKDRLGSINIYINL
jgi:hypothetical protein